MGFPGGSAVKNPPANAGDWGSIPELGSSPGEGNGNPLRSSCLGNPMNRGAWQATIHGVTESQTQLSDYSHRHHHAVHTTGSQVSGILEFQPLRTEGEARFFEVTEPVGGLRVGCCMAACPSASCLILALIYPDSPCVFLK